MRLVIDIPDGLKQKIDEGFINQVIINKLWEATKNGLPLPKCHGDLIDRDDLLADSYCIDDWSGNEVNIVDVMTVKMADAIIEARKEVKNDN